MGTQHTDTRREAVSILIVEDDGATRRFLADNLAADGYEPLEAATIRDAGRVLGGQRVDLAIVDLRLPDGDGLRLIEAIRTAGPGRSADLPLIVLSGRTGELDRVRGLERGADDFLGKPFSYAELRARVGALLRRTERRPAGTRLAVGPLELDA